MRSGGNESAAGASTRAAREVNSNALREREKYTPMMACPRYSRCSANVCPLDPEFQHRSHAAGEPICFYLLEAVKTGAKPRFERYASGEMHIGVLRAIPEIMSRWYPIKKALVRAKSSGSRMERFVVPIDANQLGAA